jgi:anti-sigma factor RsiW
VIRSARCDRSREAISLRLDGMLSAFESALLDRHLKRCPECRAFAADVGGQMQLLRSAPLELPERQVVVPATRRPVRRRAFGTLTALAGAAAAAAFALTPGGGDNSQAGAIRSSAPRVQVGAPVPVVVAAQPTPSSKETVPRLVMEPASIADGPVHGLFSTPVRA